MSKTYSISEIYNITAAFITDRDTKVQISDSDEDGTSYCFTKYGLANYPYQLRIYVPCGAPEDLKLKGSYTFSKNLLTGKFKMRWHQPYKTDKKQGEITIQRGTGINFTGKRTIVSAETKHNVGRAFDKKQRQIVQTGTRMLSPNFFKLVEMAEKRALNQLKTSDNSALMFNWLYRIQNENHK